MANQMQVVVVLSVCLVVPMVGCDSSPVLDAESRALKSQLLTGQPIGDAATIADARLAALESRNTHKTQEVIIAGTIDANGHDPWEKDKSTFVIMDASDAYLKVASAHNHDDGDCPFCKHKSEPNQFMAIVEIAGQDGQMFPRSAQPLLGLKQKQKIAVRGDAKINDLDMLVVTAKQVYVGK